MLIPLILLASVAGHKWSKKYRVNNTEIKEKHNLRSTKRLNNLQHKNTLIENHLKFYKISSNPVRDRMRKFKSTSKRVLDV